MIPFWTTRMGAKPGRKAATRGEAPAPGRPVLGPCRVVDLLFLFPHWQLFRLSTEPQV